VKTRYFISEIVIIAFCVLTTATESVTLHNHNTIGSVPDRIDIQATYESTGLPGSLDLGLNNYHLATFRVNNNNRAGYKITFSSNNNKPNSEGKLLALNSGASPEAGDLIDYVNTAKDDGTAAPSHWGMAFPQTDVVSHQLNQSADLLFDSLTKATYNGDFELRISVMPNSGAYQDSFSDSITVLISDL